MIGTMRLAVIGLAFTAFGWALAQAQGTQPDFAILVEAPSGATTVRCVRGCKLAWIERGLNPNSTPSASFGYSCTGGGSPCSSGTVGGWLAP
jgi:hypothetical protein